MKRYIILCVLSCLLFCSLLFHNPIQAQAATDTQKVYDYADVLTEEEQTNLESLCAKQGKKGKVDIVIVTAELTEGPDCEVFLENLYDEIGFGYDGTYGTAAMIIIDLANRDVCIEGYGLAETKLYQARGDYIREKITPDLSAGRYYDAFTAFIKLSARCMRLKADILPDHPLLSPWFQLLYAVVIGIVSVSIMAYHSSGKMTAGAATYQRRAITLARQDDYIRTTTTRVRRSESSGSSNRHSSGHSGHSGHGASSGGHSHSTSRGKF